MAPPKEYAEALYFVFRFVSYVSGPGIELAATFFPLRLAVPIEKAGAECLNVLFEYVPGPGVSD